MSKIALILGATGGIGFETARALKRHGWQLRVLHRRPDSVSHLLPEADWIEGDALSAADVQDAAVNAGLIVHAVNPPGYRNWKGLALPMIDNTVAAAIANRARIIFPGTIYNYGPDAFPLVSETSPQNPRTRKGVIRVEMESRLRRASESGARVLLVRAGDFFGPHMTGNAWLSSAMVKSGRPVTAITDPGRKGVGHAWAYLPDLAETIARLADLDEDLGTFETYHFGGHWFDDGADFARHVRSAASAPSARIGSFPWPVVLALSPFVRLFGEMAEMKYLWDVPVRLDNTKLVRRLGQEPHTPIEAALRASLQGMNCLPRDELTPATGKIVRHA
ncbi:MAG: NAD-dependent epimerase/dehydratase family protein [Hyphomonas sp.]|uniref:NAD-dependent epimerase/dehydratase family protein n=1 Tax=Hyphomonas sp. TaxID=87 RepID=UPI0017FE2CBD|nr:NAD-dependent epimerase/dehydratase family protein [Hyphomonas sp.]MBA3070513.1 NAD-dependent epimerase/dehydratase family protein [Hyphomonas sp.]MBU4062043.1 NAD-dependent epimerase/dehydratase family protein [Alphaproteobacteria bacterium]MBU4164979.1 NAD-dependent epimerase/dehydratase family protein [Alphaproteobacteria bacterium]